MDKTLAETLAGWRRHLHANPELSLKETGTAAFVCAKLQELGIPFTAGVGGRDSFSKSLSVTGFSSTPARR